MDRGVLEMATKLKAVEKEKEIASARGLEALDVHLPEREDDEDKAQESLERIGFVVKRFVTLRIAVYSSSIGKQLEETKLGDFDSCVHAVEQIASKNLPRELRTESTLPQFEGAS